MINHLLPLLLRIILVLAFPSTIPMKPASADQSVESEAAVQQPNAVHIRRFAYDENGFAFDGGYWIVNNLDKTVIFFETANQQIYGFSVLTSATAIDVDLFAPSCWTGDRKNGDHSGSVIEPIVDHLLSAGESSATYWQLPLNCATMFFLSNAAGHFAWGVAVPAIGAYLSYDPDDQRWRLNTITLERLSKEDYSRKAALPGSLRGVLP